MNLDQATELAMQTDYAHDAVGEEVNVADAGAFFLEGYLKASAELAADVEFQVERVIEAGLEVTEVKAQYNDLLVSLRSLSGLKFHDFETLGFGPLVAATISSNQRVFWERHIETISKALNHN